MAKIRTTGSLKAGRTSPRSRLQLDDLVYSENIGAYSNASATWFNGFPPAKVVHIHK